MMFLLLLAGCGNASESTESSGEDTVSTAQTGDEFETLLADYEIPAGYSALLAADMPFYAYYSDGEVSVTVYAAYNVAIPYLAEAYIPAAQETADELQVALAKFSVYFNGDDNSASWSTSNMETGIFFDEANDIFETGYSIDDIYELYSDTEEIVSDIIVAAGGDALVLSYDEKFGDTLDEFQGEWSKVDSSSYSVIISEDTYNIVHEYSLGSKNYLKVTTRYIDIDDDGGIVVMNENDRIVGTIYLNDDGQLVETDSSDGEETVYEYVSDNTEIPEEKVDPEVGMTEDEVLASTWGSPNKKNKTTTTYGETEQWVYDDGYIYFRNGVVITIQEY